MTLALSPARIHPRRLRALQLYVGKLQEWSRRVSGIAVGRPVALLIGKQRLVVEPWERAAIAEAGDAAEHPGLAAEALACMAKCLADIDRLSRGDDSRDAFYRLQADLLLDTAIGTALLREIQPLIERTVAGGSHHEARQLNSLMHRLRGVMSQAMERLTESNLPRVRGLADGLTDLADRSATEAGQPAGAETGIGAPEPPPLPPRVPPRPERIPARIARTPPAAHLHPRTIVLAVAAVLAFLAWMLFVGLPGALRDDPRLVTLDDLAHAHEFVEVAARPPSLFVDADAAAWKRLSQAEKWARVRETSEVVAPLGYEGLLVRGPDGEPLAQWVRGRGVQLLDGPSPD
jgi:hypothetical protein